MQKQRAVPEEKIKRLDQYVTIDDGLDPNFAVAHMIAVAGEEIARKLLEFGKVEFTKLPDERTLYSFTIEIIVPPTPERSFHAKPS